MDFSDDFLDDQSLPFSPSWFPPSPEPFQMMEFPQYPTVVGTERVNEDQSGGSIAIPAINEANPSTTQPNPPADMVQEHLFSNSDGVQRSNQQELLNSNMPNPFPEPNVSFMQQPEYQQQQVYSNPDPLNSFEDPHVSLLEQLLANSDEYQQSSDQQNFCDPNLLNSIQEIDAFLMQDDNSDGYQQQVDQQDPLNFFKEEDVSSRIDQLIGEGYNGFAQQPLIDSFELPNHFQEQLLPVPVSQSYPSYPTYQHGPDASHLNMYDQQPPPLVVANSADRPLAPRMVTDVARTYPQQNQVSMTTPPPSVPSSSTRYQVSTTTPPPSVPSNSTSHHGNVQELANQPPPTFRYREIRPRPIPFIPPQFIPPQFIPPPQPIALGRRQRRRQNQVEQGESSSAQPRLILPRVNVDSTAAGVPQERLQNHLYSPNYESLGIPIDPHLRNFVPRRRRR